MNNRNETYDVVIIGSGINSLTAATRLALAGKKVCVLERNDCLGGCIRTEELTEPGFHHDVLSGFYPLFLTSPAYAQFGEKLHEKGLEFKNNTFPTGVLLPDGRSLVLTTDRAKNIANFEALAKGDGKAYERAMLDIEQNSELTFALLGSELWNFKTARLLAKELFKRKPSGLADYFGGATQSCRSWLDGDFQSDLIKALFAPWVLHTGLGPDNALSGFMGKVIAFTLEAVGMPIVAGGSVNIVKAFEKVIADHGGVLQTDTHVDEIVIDGKSVGGVKDDKNNLYQASEGVLCNVTPTQLYGHLLRNAPLPKVVKKQAENYTYGRGDMQIHIALNEPPKWPDEILSQTAMIHVTGGMEAVARSVGQAENGVLPDLATIVVAQPTVLDPSRAPNGKWILWLQLQELPRVIARDSLNEIKIGEDGSWSEDIKEQYADRIINRLTVQIPNLKSAMIGRKTLSPKDLNDINMNLVGGDPYSGSCTLEQSFIWRPLRATKNHSTPFKNLYHIGASTHPGPGLGGVSGYLTAGHLL